MFRNVGFLAISFCAISSWSSAGTELRADDLALLIAAVEKNERLYSNIDIKVRFEYQGFGSQSKDTISSYKETHRYVSIGDRFYSLVEDSSQTESGLFRSVEESSFDGKQTITRFNGNVANIYRGRHENSMILFPHMLLHRGSSLRVPLSVYLRGTDAMASHPLGDVSPDRNASNEYLGIESIDGLKCHRVAVKANGGKSQREFWLAEDRNFLVVKSRSFSKRVRSFVPAAEGHVEGFRLTESGVWLPKRGVFTSFDKAKLEATGESVVSWTHSFDILSVSLNPKYPDEFFDSIELNGGTDVDE